VSSSARVDLGELRTKRGDGENNNDAQNIGRRTLRSLPGLGCLSEDSRAATATDLVTICMSATTTIQASKCTAWQYNVYSPTAYIESYPTVTPAETGINDPNYEYRLGSSLTPAIGVKVCPAAQTPGTSFASTSADPCPSNKLVAASTILPTYSYAIMVSPGIPTSYIPTYPVGFQVLQTNTSGSSFVAGGPFVPSPVPTGAGGSLDTVPGPSLAVLDPTDNICTRSMTPGLPQPRYFIVLDGQWSP